MARVYGLAAVILAEEPGRGTAAAAVSYLSRAEDRLQQAVTSLPEARRPVFWREVLRCEELRPLRQRDVFRQLDRKYLLPRDGTK